MVIINTCNNECEVLDYFINFIITKVGDFMSIKNSIFSFFIICNFLLVQNLYGDNSDNLINNKIELMNCEIIDNEEECVLSECTWNPDRGCYSNDYDECNEYSENLCESYDFCQWDENLNICLRIDGGDENDIENCSDVDNQEECIRIPGCDWSTVATPNGVFDMCFEANSADDAGWDECSQLSQDECTTAEYCEWNEESQLCSRFDEEDNCSELTEDECSDTEGCNWNAWGCQNYGDWECIMDCGGFENFELGLNDDDSFCEWLLEIFPTGCAYDCSQNILDDIERWMIECSNNDCDPNSICLNAITCVDGFLYPTTCGPENCDEPIGTCDENGDGGDNCDPSLSCGEAVTCVDGFLYPTTCGPANCDEPFGECDENGDGDDDCDPDLFCGNAVTCIDGFLYPTTCGPENCDESIGECDDNDDGPPDCLLDCEGVEDINSEENAESACDWLVSNFGPNNFFNECAEDCDEETLREISEYASLCYECLQNTNIDCSSVFDDDDDCSSLSYDECIQSDNCEPSLNSAGQFEGCIEGNGLDGGCYDSSGQFYSLGEVFFISECDYYICNDNGFEGPFTQDECGEDDGGGCEDGGGMIAYLELENVVGYLNQEVLVPIYLKSPEPVGGVQFKLFNSPGAVPSGINSLDDCFTAEYNSLEEAYIGIIFSLEGCSYPANEQVHIADLAFEISPFVPIGVDLDLDFDYTIVSDSEGNEIESCGIGSSIQTGMLGDVNSDGEINVLDIVSMVNFALGSDYPNDIEFWASDINGDGSINVLDIVSIVNIILAD